MFTITPIGSCRITTPLRRGQYNHGFNLNMDRCYGYCHSPAEAVQMARFMQGAADIPQDVWPLVSRKHDLNTISTNRHRASDLYVVELASAKEVTIDGVSIQLNYLNATFSEFFADSGRAQSFWQLAEAEDGSEMSKFLDQHWSETPQQQQEAQTLGRIKLRFVTRESLRRDIKTLTELLPDVLFVSHVDACKQDGRPIRSRSDFIQMVAEEVEEAGCKFYNPTRLMDDFGQTAAIEDESAGLAHFTDSFANGIMADWMRQVIAPKTDDAVLNGASAAIDRHLEPQISAACKNGQFVSAGTRLHALMTGGAPVQSLLDDIARNHEQACAAFMSGQAEGTSSNGCAERMLEASELGLFDQALKLAGTSQEGPTDLPARILFQAGELARQAAAFDAATEFLFAATTRNHGGACHALADLAIAQEMDVLSKFDPEQRSEFLSTLPAASRVKILQLNGVSFTEAVSQGTTASDAEEVVTYLASVHGIGYAAEVLAHWRELQDTDRVTDPALVSILEGWVTTALAFDQRIDRIHGLNAVLFAAPRHQPARVAMQDIRKELALLIRAAGKDGDIDLLDTLSVEASALSKELPELDLWRARLRFGLGEYAAAITLGQAAAAHMPEKINVWVLLMRAATKAQHSAEAIEFARKVIGLTCPKTEALKSEAEAVLQTKMVGA